MRGDTEGAFPIPSLPLKGNKESENTRKHLWTHSLCGFWVSPPSTLPLLPSLRGGSGAGEPGGGGRVFVLGFGKSQAALSPWPPFLSWGTVVRGTLGPGGACMGARCQGGACQGAVVLNDPYWEELMATPRSQGKQPPPEQPAADSALGAGLQNQSLVAV